MSSAKNRRPVSVGLNSNELRKSYKEIQRYNLMMLSNFSVLTVPLIVVAAITRGALGSADLHLIAAMLAFILVAACFYIISKRIYKIGKFTGAVVYTLITSFGFFIYLFSIYIDVYTSKTGHGMLFVAFLIAHQALYVMPLSWNLIMTVMPCAAFIAAAVMEKDAPIYTQDVGIVIIGLAASLIVNYITTREKIQLIVGKERIARDYDELSSVNARDSLTGLLSRAAAEEKLEDYCMECAAGRSSIFAAIVDVDFFKLYNDTYGHPEGDRILKALGDMMNAIAREYGIIAGRVGGEEFLLAGRAGSKLQATRICDRLRYEVQNSRIENKSSSVASFITISVGVAFAEFGSEIKAEALYKKADDALYEAKRAGRNCVKTSMD